MQTVQKSIAVSDMQAGNMATLASMIAAVGFREVNPNITQANFGRKPKSLVVRQGIQAYTAANMGISKNATHEILAGMRQAGVRPAKLSELLAYAKSAWNGRDTVAALDSMWTSERTGHCYVPCLIGNGRGDRDLCLRRGHLGFRWDEGCRFLVIAK